MITRELWSRLEPLLDRALDQPVETRTAFLRAACGDHLTLRQQLDAMIAECEQRDEVLDATAIERYAGVLEDPPPSPLQPPPVLADRYRIVRELGRGGMATVYVALDLRHQRRVAVKLLDSTVSAVVLRDRFLSEIQIAARLAHPHIVTVHDSGEADGLLFYVMPYIDGESLRACLQRERHLGLSDALRITIDVCDALSYAHANRVVHRDIKPENILLDNGHAMVCDFGIARAVEEAGGTRLTATGTVIGTAPYMSPEQGTGDAGIDYRSDIYSLACVLYEMLAGTPPFTATTRQQVIAQHIAAAVPSLRIVRRSVPVGLERAIERALAKLPADRFQSAKEFAEAIAAHRDGTGMREPAVMIPRRPRARVVRSLAALALVASTLSLASDGSWAERGPATSRVDAPALDAGRLVVLPAEGNQRGTSVDVAEALRGALREWSGITVVTKADVDEALGGRLPEQLGGLATRRLGESLGAGHVVRLRVEPLGDSLNVSASLVDTRTAQAVATQAARAPKGAGSDDPAISRLAEELLFHDARPARAARVRGTRSYAAFQAYLTGHIALDEWDLTRADSQFVAATRADPQFAQAFLWLAQVRIWAGDPAARWTYAAQKAAVSFDRLTAREKLLARAVVALSLDDVGTACSLWSRLVRADTNDYATWYGLGNCLERDNVVVRDLNSPSGWAFRTSYGEVLRSYEHAFRLHLEIYHSYRGNSPEQWQRVFKTASNSMREGRALHDTTRFMSYPTWQSDSLAFVPLTASEFASARTVTRSRRVDEAVAHQRTRFHQLTTTWRAAFPSSAGALEAVSVALDLLGNHAALDSLRAARRLAQTDDDRLRIGTLEVWVRLKYSLPLDRAGTRAARALADSLLDSSQPGTSNASRRLAGLAVLLGHANRAATLTRRAEADQTPAAIADAAPALLAFAAMGGPADSLHALEAYVIRAINQLDGEERNRATSSWLMLSALLAIPDRGLQWTPVSAEGGSVGAQLLSAWRARDVLRARTLLGRLRDGRRDAVRASDLTMDAVFPEAAILASLGDEREAIAWLAPTLDSLALAEPQNLANIARAGPLVRAMALRAELAARAGDRASARSWSAAVVDLWSGADDFLRPVLHRMEALAQAGR